MFDQQEGSRTIIGDSAPSCFDIIWLEYLVQIAADRTELFCLLAAEVAQFHHRGVAVFIFQNQEQIDYPDNAFIARGAQFRQNLAREPIAFKSDDQVFQWTQSHTIAPFLYYTIHIVCAPAWQVNIVFAQRENALYKVRSPPHFTTTYSIVSRELKHIIKTHCF